MPKELTWKKAINQVLAASAVPLHYKDITEIIISDGLRTSLGATPAATVNAQISASIKRHGASSPYVRVAKGTFTLSKKDPPTTLSRGSSSVSFTEDEDRSLTT